MEDLKRNMDRIDSNIIIIARDDKILWNSNESIPEKEVNRVISEYNKISQDKINGQIYDFKLEINNTSHNIIAQEFSYSDKDKPYILMQIMKIKDKNEKMLMDVIINNMIKENIYGVMITDINGRIIVYNKMMAKIEDKKVEKVLGKSFENVYKCPLKKNDYKKVFKSGKALLNNYKIHSKDEKMAQYAVYNIYPIKFDGKIQGVCTIAKSEVKLHEVLSQTIESKRKHFIEEGDKSNNSRYYGNGTSFKFSDIIGSSPDTLKLIEEAQSIAWTDTNILIIGDTGTGKEVFAQSIHNYGDRKDSPFIGINCSAIPENLLESTLFGTKKGAFTGAIDSEGLFRDAKDGTIFLDELNSMPKSMQVKLLRVIQERRVRPIGDSNTYPINCRIISAMNKDPHKTMKDDELREDLYYRVAGFNLYLSPLKDREEDILDFIEIYIENANKRFNKNIEGISAELKNRIMSYKWPGNVRELEHFVENLMVRVDSNKRELDIDDIPEYMRKKFLDIDEYIDTSQKEGSLSEILEHIEREMIIKELNKNDWNVSKTSRKLGIIRQSLIYRMKKLEIEE